ncbi:hypothetical protein VNO77_06653 [Canavalia gladiata]|uniref:Uncharacterized protein n=1 Tax=Canavalia gladiata TaxID=3824 RepID=A0AAN9MCI9_CANGL
MDMEAGLNLWSDFTPLCLCCQLLGEHCTCCLDKQRSKIQGGRGLISEGIVPPKHAAQLTEPCIKCITDPDVKKEVPFLYLENLWFLFIMMKSPAQPTYEACHYDDYGFDLQQDFCQFLEEAKQHGKEARLKSSSVHPEESGKTGSGKEKKGKKTWKSSLISWWKADKKSKHKEEAANNSKPKVYGKRKGHSSGPMHNSYKGSNGKQWRPSSGPLTSLFKSTNKEENEIPYISLHQQNSPRAMQKYGPLYVVT